MNINGNVNRFTGRHWETGSIHNALAMQGFLAPHTGKPFSEALLLGVSGGITFGYFTFEYTGQSAPSRIAHPEYHRSCSCDHGSPGYRAGCKTNQQGEKSLKRTFSKRWKVGCSRSSWQTSSACRTTHLTTNISIWAMLPILATGFDGETVEIADRSSQSLHISMAKLTEARGRVKKDRYRLTTLDAPQPAKLAAAVSKGIYQSLQLYTEKPPKGAAHNFGFAAYQWLADMLENTETSRVGNVTSPLVFECITHWRARWGSPGPIPGSRPGVQHPGPSAGFMRISWMKRPRF